MHNFVKIVNFEDYNEKVCFCDSYASVANASEGLFKDKGSRFLAYVYPIGSEVEVKTLVDALKKEHHAARHHCFAYRLGISGSVCRTCDDGEPSGTAGKPIMAAIESAGVSDVLVVVVRYFGGILLGVPGLARAYREAANDALSKAVKIEKVVTDGFELLFAYEEMNQVQNLVKTFDGLSVAEQKFDVQCSMTVKVRRGRADFFVETVKKINDEKSLCIQCRAL